MGWIKTAIPHCQWRDGRPRFTPGPRLRELGFASRDLCDVPARDAKRQGIEPGWWDRERVVAWIRDELMPAIEKAKAKAAGATMTRRLRHALGGRHDGGPTVADLVEWSYGRPKADGAPLAAGSLRFYRHMADAVAAEVPELWTLPARSVRTARVYAALMVIRDRRSLEVAQGCRALLSRAWSHARLVEWQGITENPAADLSLPKPKGRIRSATVAEIRALVAAADAIGRADVGDLIVAGVTTAQRRGDRLALEWPAVRDGWLTIRQQKTGTVVEVPVFRWLADRMDAARARRSGWTVAPLQVFPNERGRRAFAGATYNGLFHDVVAAAVGGVRDGALEIVAPTPSLAGFRDQDLRDTFITWAIEEGLTAEQIAAISGHARASVQQMVDAHYGARTRPQATAVANRVEEKIDRG